MLRPGIYSHDVLVLIKLASLDSATRDIEFVSAEIGHSSDEVSNSFRRLYQTGLVKEETNEVSIPDLREFILYAVQYLFPTRPGRLIKGMLTGAKPGMYFAAGLPYTSIWAWETPDGKHHGYEITPLSQQCTFAASNDSRVKHLLAITETMRVAGREAREWAEKELDRFIQEREARQNGAS